MRNTARRAKVARSRIQGASRNAVDLEIQGSMQARRDNEASVEHAETFHVAIATVCLTMKHAVCPPPRNLHHVAPPLSARRLSVAAKESVLRALINLTRCLMLAEIPAAPRRHRHGTPRFLSRCMPAAPGLLIPAFNRCHLTLSRTSPRHLH